MLLVSLLGGLGFLALRALASRAGRRLHPAEWAPLCVLAVAGGAAAVEVSLILYAMPTVAHSSGNPQLAELCEPMLPPQAPGGQVAGWGAAAAATILAALAALGWSRARGVAAKAQVEAGVGRHTGYRRHELVVLPTAQPVALSVPAVAPGGRGQIVVSDGLLAALAPGEVDAVLDHEAAHLEHGHHRYLAVAAAVDPWTP